MDRHIIELQWLIDSMPRYSRLGIFTLPSLLEKYKDILNAVALTNKKSAEEIKQLIEASKLDEMEIGVLHMKPEMEREAAFEESIAKLNTQINALISIIETYNLQ
jgi:hypothetical protein